MKELVNFIPKTVAECRELLTALQNNRDGVTIPNRDGKYESLDAGEIKALIELIENQIGEKAPEVNTPAEEKTETPKKDSKVPATRPAPKKSSK